MHATVTATWLLPAMLLLTSPPTATALEAPGTTTAGRCGNTELLVISTASNRGEVDHCGCARARKGGLPWRACLIDSLRTGDEALLVDAGDFMHPDRHRDDALDRFVIEAMGSMGYRAMTLGELELERGVDTVKRLVADSPVPITLANVSDAATGEPIGEPFLIEEVNGLRVAITGLLGQELGEDADAFTRLGITVDDPFEVASALVPRLAGMADLVMVLSHMTTSDAIRLPELVPDIDLLVLGHDPGTTAATRIGGTVIIRSGQRGQYLGVTRVQVGPENAIVAASGQAVPILIDTVCADPEMARALHVLLGAIETGSNARGNTSD